MSQIKSTKCYIEEYENERRQLSARLRGKVTGRKVDLGLTEGNKRDFLRFLSGAHAQKTVIPDVFSRNGDKDCINHGEGERGRDISAELAVHFLKHIPAQPVLMATFPGSSEGPSREGFPITTFEQSRALVAALPVTHVPAARFDVTPLYEDLREACDQEMRHNSRASTQSLECPAASELSHPRLKPRS